MQCASFDSIMTRRITGDSSSLMCETRSMRRIVRKFFGPSDLSGLVACSYLSTAISAGALL